MRKIKKNLKQILVLIGLLLTSFNYLFAQDVPQPDFVNTPAYYIEGSSELHNLAKETMSMVGKPGKALYEFAGPASKVRINSADDYVLIIMAGDVDPSTMMQLQKAKITKKNNRQIMMAQIKGFMTAKVEPAPDALSYNLKKLDTNIYRIVPDSKLEPGEYIITIGATMFSFAIE